MTKTVTIRVGKGGKVEISDMKGFVGTECERATAAIERRLGKTDESSRCHVAGYFERTVEQQNEAASTAE